MRTSNLLLKLNLRMNSTARRTMGKVSLPLLFLALIVCVPSRPMQASRSEFATGIAPAAAQQVIACGQTLSGSITAVGQQVTYTFNANAGEAVNISAVATSGALCARGDLYGPTGDLIAVNPGDCNGITMATLPATGTYTIVVRDRFANNTGTYNVNLQFTTGRCATPITCGQTITISTPMMTAEQDAYNFTANAGEVVAIAAVATSGTLCARGDLYGPTGNLIAVNPSDCNGITRATLPATGTYTIVVRDRFANNTGTYNINLQFTTGRCGIVIDCGQTKSGTIQTADQNTFIFCGVEGSSVAVAAVSTSGALCARGDLYGPTGNLIAVNPSDCNGITRATLPATGTYTIVVRDRFANNTGTYNVNLSCIGPTCSSPPSITLTPSTLTITAGAKVNLTVAISPSQNAATVVTLSSSNAAIASVPSSITIQANATSATFEVMGVAPGPVTITATLPASLQRFSHECLGQ